MKDLRPETRRILELAQSEDAPAPGTAERVERSLRKRIALSAALVGGSTALSKSAVGAGLLSTALKSAVVAGVTTGVALIGWEVLAGDGAAPPAREAGAATSGALAQPLPSQRGATVKDAARLVDPSPPATPDAPAPGDFPDVPHEVPQKERAPKPNEPPKPRTSLVASERTFADPPASEPRNERSPADQLAHEANELREAQQALRSGNPTRALRLLDQQQARYPAGSLAQERSAAQVFALCQAGQVAQARRAALQFESRFPASPLLGRVRAACLR